jgi:hypothetical protein
MRGKWQLLCVRFADIGLLQVLQGFMFLEQVGCFLVSTAKVIHKQVRKNDKIPDVRGNGND